LEIYIDGLKEKIGIIERGEKRLDKSVLEKKTRD